MRLRVLAAVTILGAGCGSVSDNKNNPDAAIDATDTRPPMIAGSHPDMGEKGVSPVSAISIRFDESLDMSSVTASTVKARFVSRPEFFDIFGYLRLENAGAVEGTVSYVAAERKVLFVPLLPLPFNSQVDVTLDGIKDAAGVAMPMTHLTFDVLANVDRYWTFYNTTNGAISFAYSFADVNGLQTKYAPVNNPGADQIYFTADDVTQTHIDFRNDAQGRFTVADAYQPGIDGVYGTADDVENQTFTIAYDAMGHVASAAINSDKGLDTVWGTADDVPTSVYGATWQGDNFVGFVVYNDKGLDGVWRTADDKSASGSTFTKYQYDAMGHKSRQIDYQPGADLLVGTADDVILRYNDLTTDAHGVITQAVRKDKGSDNVWFTADDVTTGYIKYTRDAHGNATETLSYLNNPASAGADMTYMTGDDVASARATATFNAAGQLTEETPNYAAGGDGVIGTADDVPTGYDVFKYQTNGARISQTFFSGPGPDAMWKTADDVYSQQFSFDVEH